MLLLRRLHTDLASGGGSPRRAATGAGYGAGDGDGDGFIIDSALTPLSGDAVMSLGSEVAMGQAVNQLSKLGG